MGHREQGLGDCRVLAVGGDPAGEGLVDLERVQREVLEVVERRVSGAEVVDRQPHPHALETLQYFERERVVLHDPALGDLDLELTRFDSGLFECLRQAGDEPGNTKLAR